MISTFPPTVKVRSQMTAGSAALFQPSNILQKTEPKVILASHMGRPKGKPDPAYSLKIVADRLSELLNRKILFVSEPEVTGPATRAAAEALKPGEIMLMENVRYRAEETKNQEPFTKELADLADIFVNDAFGTAHRAHCSTAGIAAYLPAVSGFLMEKEIRLFRRYAGVSGTSVYRCHGRSKSGR